MDTTSSHLPSATSAALQMDGIMSEALGIDKDAWGLWEVNSESRCA